MSILYVVRHGESTGNADPSTYSKTPNWILPLTETGCDQATAAGQWIQKDAFKSINVEITRDVTENETHRLAPMQIICSPYLRTANTAKIISKIFNKTCKTNMLLAEWNPGEQEGVTQINDFDNRPVEKHFQSKLGRLHYKPHRGESFLDVHVRAGVFVCQQNFFAYHPHTVIVAHKELNIALHHFLLETIAIDCQESWNTGEVRKYQRDVSKFEYLDRFSP